MEKETVAVVFRADLPGQRRLAYAADLASRLKCGLSVLLPTEAGERDLADSLGLRAVAGAEVVVADAEEIRRVISPEKTIAVTPGPDPLFAACRQVWPADEDRVQRRPDRPVILFPFGDSDAAWRAAPTVFRFAFRLHARVVLYHTTWPDPRETSLLPRRHMCDEAIAVETGLVRIARQEALEDDVTAVIEMADAVDKGTHRAALRVRASLIAAIRGEGAVKGSHVDTLRERSAVPMLVVA